MPNLGIIASGVSTTPNTIAQENALPGYAPSSWNISGIGDAGALGYTTTMSVAAGSSIDFKIHSGGTAYTLEIIRLGWYGGNGARLITTISHPGGATQPESTLRTQGEGGVGSRECSSWTVTDTWSVPPLTTHGVYLGVIKRSGQPTFGHVGPFVVTNTVSTAADILCKLSDFTWRAYNTMGTLASPVGGKSLYGTGSGVFSEGSRAWDVSYDAPLVTASGVPQTTYWNGEWPVHAFLERNGYDVAYASCLDVDANPSLLLGRSVIISAGHDEYWSQNVRDAWDAAIASGVHSIIASGNTMLWRVRMSGRLMVCYKDSHSFDGGKGIGIDPVSWTGTWRDPRGSARRGENETIGAVFVANGIRFDEITLTAPFAAEPLWRGTTVAALTGGSTEGFKTDCLGFEWDTFEPSYANTLAYPPATKFLSSTSVNLTSNAANENGSVYNTTINPCLHNIIAFKKGASLTVNFGTNQWGWGLSDLHVRGATGENTTMKQATVNLLADMGCQPTTLQSGLSAATDALASWTWPTLSTLNLPSAAVVDEGMTTPLTAVATWSNGLTTDLTPFATWSSSATGIATVNSRGVVTGVNVGSATITATYGATSDTCTIVVNAVGEILDTFQPYDYAHVGTLFTDGAITLGTRFRNVSTEPINVNGVRIWRSTTAQSAAPVAYLGAVGGATLASATSSIASAPATPRWDEILFSTPIVIPVGTGEYIVWVWLPSGGYYSITSYFPTPARPSQLGLFDSGAGASAGRFRQPPAASPDTTQPVNSFGNNFYLVEPLIGTEVIDPGDVTALNVTPATASITPTTTQQLTAMASWEHVSDTNVTTSTAWVSSNTGVATVGAATGLVTAVAAGSATITGTYAGFSDTCAVTVTTATFSHAWTGADPTASTDTTNYNLGTYFSLFSAITIQGLRIWNPGLVTPQGGQNRQGYLWTATGITGAGAILQRTIDLPDLMPTGWSEHLFSTPYSAATGIYYCVSYFVDGGATAGTSDYGAVAGALGAGPIDSGPIRFEQIGGRYNVGATPGVIPGNVSGGGPFYGIDILYSV